VHPSVWFPQNVAGSEWSQKPFKKNPRNHEVHVSLLGSTILDYTVLDAGFKAQKYCSRPIKVELKPIPQSPYGYHIHTVFEANYEARAGTQYPHHAV
jgi:hypothetical protein